MLFCSLCKLTLKKKKKKILCSSLDSALYTFTTLVSLDSKDTEIAFSLKSELWSEETNPVFVSLATSFIQGYPVMTLPLHYPMWILPWGWLGHKGTCDVGNTSLRVSVEPILRADSVGSWVSLSPDLLRRLPNLSCFPHLDNHGLALEPSFDGNATAQEGLGHKGRQPGGAELWNDHMASHLTWHWCQMHPDFRDDRASK